MAILLKSSIIKEMSNGIIEAAHNIITGKLAIGQVNVHQDSLIQPEMGVLLGITGDNQCRLLVDSGTMVFSILSNLMFGIGWEGDMHESFVGEIGNMVGGNMCTNVSRQGIHLDITHLLF